MCESYSRKRGEGAVSLQRIILGARNARGAVSCRRVGTSSLRKGELLHARSTYQPGKGIVSLVAARLVINSVRLLALPDELLGDRPWLRPHGRILDGDHVSEGVPRPPLSLTHVVDHRDAARRLHDPGRALASDPRQPGGQAADRRRAVLRTIMAIDRYRVVAGRALRESRRGRRIVFAAGTAPVLDPASLGRLQQGEAKFPLGGGNLLS